LPAVPDRLPIAVPEPGDMVVDRFFESLTAIFDLFAGIIGDFLVGGETHRCVDSFLQSFDRAETDPLHFCV